MALPVVIRLAVLPWLPPPTPWYPDEFGHLLVAETLESGRLANPPHPLARHFETIYVLQQPTYASKYPIGQGIPLAVGQVLTGSAWAGVLLSAAAMSGAIAWMLFGALPTGWAVLGSVLAALQFGLAPRWINSFWGGAFCAFGGALFFGGLWRLSRGPSIRNAAILAVGWSIVWLIRPYESVFVFVVGWLVVIFFALRSRQWQGWIGTAIAVALVQLLAGAVTVAHNRAVTGSSWTLPYVLHQQESGVPQSFFWQKPIPRPRFTFREAAETYDWQLDRKEALTKHPLRQLGTVVADSWNFFVTPWFSLAMAALVFSLRDRRVLALSGMVAVALLGSGLYPFFFTHYLAAYAGVFTLLIMLGLMNIWRWAPGSRPIGRVLVVLLVFGAAAASVRQIVPVSRILGRESRPEDARRFRQQVLEHLRGLGGRHVVFVRYGPRHNFREEWVYNEANIDAAQIVWCRTTDEAGTQQVLNYYPDRRVWIADVDREYVRLTPYDSGADAKDAAFVLPAD